MGGKKDALNALIEKSGWPPAFARTRDLANAGINPLRTSWFDFLGRRISSHTSGATQAMTPTQRS